MKWSAVKCGDRTLEMLNNESHNTDCCLGAGCALQKSSRVGVSPFVNNFLLSLILLNSPFLSSETKSLSLTLAVEEKSIDTHHLNRGAG